jgi:hypothetical protein
VLTELNHLSSRGMNHTFMTGRRDTSNTSLDNSVERLDGAMCIIEKRKQFPLADVHFNYFIYTKWLNDLVLHVRITENPEWNEK